MAKFRTYKNGITGLRYQGYFIVSNEANPDKFDIIDENHYPLVQLYDSIEECKWYLDKYTATPEQIEMIEQLATMEIYELNHRMMELFLCYFKVSEAVPVPFPDTPHDGR